jgi:hypothetical protein
VKISTRTEYGIRVLITLARSHGSVDEQAIADSGFLLGSTNKIYNAEKTVHLPVLDVQNNNTIRAYARGVATAEAHAAGAAMAGATTRMSEENDSFYLQGTYLDLRLQSSSNWWTDTSRCVEYW